MHCGKTFTPPLVTKFPLESVGVCPFRGLYVREFELSHSNPVARSFYKHNSCTQFAGDGAGLCSFSIRT